MRCACIDVGSNTTRLLVAELKDGLLAPVLTRRTFTRLGAGRDAGDPVGAARGQELAAVVAAQARLARAAGAQEIRIVATAAVRSAPDREALCAVVASAAHAPVTVLSGAQEAHAAFRGAVVAARPQPHGRVGLADVGGGSCELAWGAATGAVEGALSVPVGSGLLTERHVRRDPPSAAELDAVRAAARAAFAAGAEPPPVLDSALAVGGSTTSLGRLVGPWLTQATLEAAIATVVATPSAEAARRLGLHPRRARLLPAGLVLLQQAGAVLGQPLAIAAGGMREGVLLAMFEKAKGPT